MENVASRYRRVIEELISQGVPLVYLKSVNGHFVSIVTTSGVAVLTPSRTTAIQAGIVPDSAIVDLQSKREPLGDRVALGTLHH